MIGSHFQDHIIDKMAIPASTIDYLDDNSRDTQIDLPIWHQKTCVINIVLGLLCNNTCLGSGYA